MFEDPELRAEYDLGTFDAIYFDTFQEGYRAFLEFFKYVPGLLKGPESRMCFFQGHGRFDDYLYEVSRHIFALTIACGLTNGWEDV